MSTSFDNAFAATVGHEGGYSNDPRDPGDETMWGVTVAVARANGYAGPMREMPLYVAKAIYQTRYWAPIHGDELPADIADDLFDIAVNHGVDVAIKALQTVLHVTVDGHLGPITIAAARTADLDKVVMGLIGLRILRYVLDRNWAAFGRGWARRAAGQLLAQAGVQV